MKVYILLVRDDSGLPYPKKGDVFVVKDTRRAFKDDGMSQARIGIEVDLEMLGGEVETARLAEEFNGR